MQSSSGNQSANAADAVQRVRRKNRPRKAGPSHRLTMKKSSSKKSKPAATAIKKPAKKAAANAEVVEPEILDKDHAPAGPGRSITVADPLVAYLSEIKKYELLTPEDEKKFA